MCSYYCLISVLRMPNFQLLKKCMAFSGGRGRDFLVTALADSSILYIEGERGNRANCNHPLPHWPNLKHPTLVLPLPLMYFTIFFIPNVEHFILCYSFTLCENSMATFTYEHVCQCRRFCFKLFQP